MRSLAVYFRIYQLHVPRFFVVMPSISFRRIAIVDLFQLPVRELLGVERTVLVSLTQLLITILFMLIITGRVPILGESGFKSAMFREIGKGRFLDFSARTWILEHRISFLADDFLRSPFLDRRKGFAQLGCSTYGYFLNSRRFSGFSRSLNNRRYRSLNNHHITRLPMVLRISCTISRSSTSSILSIVLSNASDNFMSAFLSFFVPHS